MHKSLSALKCTEYCILTEEFPLASTFVLSHYCDQANKDTQWFPVVFQNKSITPHQDANSQTKPNQGHKQKTQVGEVSSLVGEHTFQTMYFSHINSCAQCCKQSPNYIKTITSMEKPMCGGELTCRQLEDETFCVLGCADNRSPFYVLKNIFISL